MTTLSDYLNEFKKSHTPKRFPCTYVDYKHNKLIFISYLNPDKAKISYVNLPKENKLYYHIFVGINYDGEFTQSVTIPRSGTIISLNENEICQYMCKALKLKYDISSIAGMFKNNIKYFKLIKNMVDSGLVCNTSFSMLQISNDLLLEGNIKKCFGVSVKYLRIASSKDYSFQNAIKLAKLCNSTQIPFDKCNKLKLIGSYGILKLFYSNLSREELLYLCDLLDSNKIDSQFYNCINYYIDYLSIRKSLKDFLHLNVSSLPRFPNDNSVSNILKLHDKATDIYNKYKIVIQSEMSRKLNEQYKSLYYSTVKSFEFSDDKFSIIACKDLSELTTEGNKLHHCVGSYRTSVSTGVDYILFLRKNSEIDEPYFTININPDKQCIQIHGLCNCNITDSELRNFVERWAKQFDITLGKHLFN